MMERRHNDRIKVQYEAKVTAVNDPARSALGRVSDISVAGISVALPFQAGAGDALRLEMADSTLFGQVAYSNPDGTAFRTGIKVDRVVLGTTDLSRFLQRTLLDTMPELSGLDAVEVYPG